jgi:hypothetical protein
MIKKGNDLFLYLFFLLLFNIEIIIDRSLIILMNINFLFSIK